MKTILVVIGFAIVIGGGYFLIGVPMIKGSLAEKIILAEKNQKPDKNGLMIGLGMSKEELIRTKTISELRSILKNFNK